MKSLRPYYTNLWILTNPVVVYRVLRGFFRALVLRRNTLKTIELYPTFECQSRCVMCSVAKYQRRGGRSLSIEEYERLAEEGARMGAIAMTLLGGEPLLSKDAEEIVRIFKRRHYFVTMVSNALAVTPERIRSLKAAGLDSAYFSLESLDEAENDRIRGVAGHYRKVMEAVGICRQEGVLTGLCGVIFPGQLDRFKALLEYCGREGLLTSGGEVAVVGAADGKQDLLVSEEEHREVLKLLRTHSRLTFDWALSYFLKPRCPAGKEKIGITCHGDVIGCSLNPIAFGNVTEEPLDAIWRRMGEFSAFKADSDRCLTAANREYIRNFMVPIAGAEINPIPFDRHPSITPEKEPELYCGRGGCSGGEK